MVHQKPGFFWLCLLLTAGTLILSATSCQAISSIQVEPNPTRLFTLTSITPSETPAPTLTPTLPAPTATPQSTAIPFFEPAGCARPLSSYTPVQIGDWTINERTYAMLQHAADLYQGRIDLTGASITQGSYHDNGAASFGTHLGGGAVDISLRDPQTYTILYGDMKHLIMALRAAGFAAWVRAPDELFPGSALHIHAIAIGDEELSKEAQDQLTGAFGYFRGYSGVPQASGIPVPDRHGEPIVCQWMAVLGYQDLRPNPSPGLPPYPTGDWRSRLVASSLAYITRDMTETIALARQLNYLPGIMEQPAGMDRPLAGAILRDASLLPAGYTPLSNLRNWVLETVPETTFNSWFASPDFEVIHFSLTALDSLETTLRPGDLVTAIANEDQPARMFVVTEITPAGEQFTVTSIQQPDGTYRVERLRVVDLLDPQAGTHTKGSSSPQNDIAFSIIRWQGIGLPPGKTFQYIIQPGDTIISITTKFNSTITAIAAANDFAEIGQLPAGRRIIVPVNITP